MDCSGFPKFRLAQCLIIWRYILFLPLCWLPCWFQEQYKELHPGGVNPVQINDVVFTLHAIAATAFTIFQCFIFEVRPPPLSTSPQLTSCPIFSEREATCLHSSLDPSGPALAGCHHLPLCGSRRKTLVAQLSLRLLLREAGRHSCQVYPSGLSVVCLMGKEP